MIENLYDIRESMVKDFNYLSGNQEEEKQQERQTTWAILTKGFQSIKNKISKQ